MNTYNYTYKGVKKKLTLSVNKDLVRSAKEIGINLSSSLIKLSLSPYRASGVVGRSPT